MGKGRRGKLLIWAACPAGAGSSTLIKLQAEEAVRAAGLESQVEFEAISANYAKTEGCDILVCTLNLSDRFSKELSIPVVGIKNVMSKQEYQNSLIPVIHQLLGRDTKP